ncbi:MAG: hypothetical protein NVSMB24_17650 [Mucilaginibacter sp.]
MKFILLVLCCTLSLSASAQWYRLDLKTKKHERSPLLAQLTNHSIYRIPVATFSKPKIQMLHFDRSDYSLEAAEAVIMKTAQHNMRFRVYNDASYNFSELAALYVQQNRFSEAKWFLLQSNIISRNENDDKHTISNLIELATIKAQLGDYTQAQEDLTEAHAMAMSRGFRDDLLQIEKKIQFIKQNKASLAPKPELRYAEAAMTAAKAE